MGNRMPAQTVHHPTPANEKLPLSRRKKILFFGVLFGILLPLVFSLLYFGSLLSNTAQLYQFVKSNQYGWKGALHAYDPALGLAPIPNSQGAEILYGAEIPVRFDQNGFRVPADDTLPPSPPRPLTLALGCSFTYGTKSLAEETYPYRVGRYMNGTSLNAGVTGYGLAQMLILARRLIPQYKPDYVLVQYSPWLVDRAQSPFFPTFYGRVATPFFADSPDGGLFLQPPLFVSNIFDLPTAEYRDTPPGVADYLSFLEHVGLPLFVYTDFNTAFYRAKIFTGLVPPPTGNREKVVEYVYGEIAKLCQENQARMLIVLLGSGPPLEGKELQALRGIKYATIVDAQSALYELADENEEIYSRAYQHWLGSPPVVVDHHPNAAAHEIIASEILRAMTRPEEEIARLERVGSDAQKDSLYYIQLGAAYRDVGRFAEAADAYGKAFRLAPASIAHQAAAIRAYETYLAHSNHRLAGHNLFPNGDFSQGISEWDIDVRGIKGAVDPDVGHESPPAGALTGERPGDSGGGFQAIELEPGNVYLYRLYIKVDNARDLTIDPLYYNAPSDPRSGYHGEEIKGETLPDGWVRLETVIAPIVHGKEKVQFTPVVMSGMGTVWIDDVQLIQLSSR
jgi:tetratricopeptide (TPR) repeat protein